MSSIGGMTVNQMHKPFSVQFNSMEHWKYCRKSHRHKHPRSIWPPSWGSETIKDKRGLHIQDQLSISE